IMSFFIHEPGRKMDEVMESASAPITGVPPASQTASAQRDAALPQLAQNNKPGIAWQWPAITAGTTGLTVFAGALWVLTRRRNGHRLPQLPKIFHAIHWPFTVTESTSL